MPSHFLNDVANDAVSTQKSKIESNVISARFKIKTIGKLINRIPGLASFDIKFTRIGF